MKKVLFVFLVVAALAVSCKNQNAKTSAPVKDSTEVVVDSLKIDSLKVDTLKLLK